MALPQAHLSAGDGFKVIPAALSLEGSQKSGDVTDLNSGFSGVSGFEACFIFLSGTRAACSTAREQMD